VIQSAVPREEFGGAGRYNPGSRPPRSPAMVMPSTRASGSPSINMRSEKVPESPSSALQVIVLSVRRADREPFSLDPGWEAGAAAAAQPESNIRLYDLRRCPGTAPGAAPGIRRSPVVRDALRIDNAHAREGQALLACETTEPIDQSERERVLTPLGSPGKQNPAHRQALPVRTDPPLGRHHLQPGGSSPTGAREPLRTRFS